MIHLHEVIFRNVIPRINEDLKEALDQIGDWFVEELFTYIRIYGSEIGPHALLRYILERISLREVVNQTTLNDQAQKLSKLQKKIWPNFPIKFGKLSLKDGGHAFKEAEKLQCVWIDSLPHYDYDPSGKINDHYKVVSYIKTFTHQNTPFDDVFINIDDFVQAVERGKLLSNEERAKLQEFRENTYEEFLEHKSLSFFCLYSRFKIS